ncbi:hypothetical protein [Chondromyces apiculatus]|uniref:Uncharacterized protein n=1 Tax=Chondromyces apiculatus DSM 436 TaxID=1192034 RepID=A0A017T1F8_9BACT|nr:hypothetical protein [Chondromyces apiculatus]EYF02842.1 Hypothetical protein CAP_6422 [Chondromyces apiculatus DSM 436]
MARLGLAGLCAALVIAAGGCQHCGASGGTGATPPTGSEAASGAGAAPTLSAASAASAAPADPASVSPGEEADVSNGRGRSAIEELLKEARRGGGREVAFVVPGEDEVKRHAALVAALARRGMGAQAPAAEVLAREVAGVGEKPLPGGEGGALLGNGIEVRAVAGRHDLLAIVEAPDRRRGAGAILLRLGPARPVLVEAPHTFYDGGTLPIAIAAFEGLRARALLINTVHRYASIGHKAPADEEMGGSDSDVAHAPSSHFLGAHEALLEVEPQLLTVQLHGFKDASAPGVDMVVSASRTKLKIGPVAEVLRTHLAPAVVRAFPDEIDRLGGTTNAQAAVSRRRGAPFLHVEMSRALRDRLEKEASPLVEGLRACLPEGRAP